MTPTERRSASRDRRSVPRGGRRTDDQNGLRFPRVLIADSYDGARLPCAKYLDRFNFDVDEACDGDETVRKVAARQMHIVLLEAGLPDAPVPRIVDILQSDPSARQVPLIVMTSELEAGTEGLDGIPLVAVLAKPFTLSSMLQEIRRLLREQPPIPLELSVCPA